MELIFVGDTGSGEREQYIVARSMEKLIKRNKKIKSVVIVGDNIYPEGCHSLEDEQFITKFQKPYRNIHLPFYLCLGNHDYGSEFSDNSQIQIKYTFSEYNTDKKWNIPYNWYTKSFPQCDLFIIDTNFERLSESQIRTQLNDTIQNIKKSTKQWKILCGHHTWRSVGGHGTAENQHELFMNRLLQSVSIDLYVCGHDHCKSIIEMKKNKTHTLVIGTGGKSYDSEMFYPEKLNETELLHFYSPNLGICHMKCTKKTLSLTCYNDKLKEEYSFKINK